jgi:EAL domain-containing protein (putative c-di-GMP-specific phosphodiesterase class I)
LPDSTDNQLFVRTLVDLARNFHLAIVAESVSNEAEAELLRSYGVDLFQGFYFGRPDITPAWPTQVAAAASA